MSPEVQNGISRPTKGHVSTKNLKRKTNTVNVITNSIHVRIPFYRSEYSAFWKCVQAGAAYLFTQLCKMLVLATFFPASEVPAGGFDIVGVSVNKYTVNSVLLSVH